MDRNLFFILRGKLVMGVEHKKHDCDEGEIFKLTHAVGKLSKMASKKFDAKFKDKSSDG
jgi:hypothetical protein